ncbi:MAG: XTP/dITP diphosphatase [Ruminococcaceae bacterium]|nr:XTP/dITP diphosphatase [Oscillospiraceae bacterium]
MDCKIVAATNNKNKLREFKEILSPLGYQIVSLKDLGIEIEVEETGKTFEENSMLKAKAILEATGMASLADDSGLEVDALGGEPGIYSARYCEGSDADRVAFLLDKMKDVPDGKRSARFVSAITLMFTDGDIVTARGTCEGKIAHEPAGKNGFGYDPIFFVESYGKTFAELSPEQKNMISHRGNALSELQRQLI